MKAAELRQRRRWASRKKSGALQKAPLHVKATATARVTTGWAASQLRATRRTSPVPRPFLPKSKPPTKGAEMMEAKTSLSAPWSAGRHDKRAKDRDRARGAP